VAVALLWLPEGDVGRARASGRFAGTDASAAPMDVDVDVDMWMCGCV
jgi:hypothetical protein